VAVACCGSAYISLKAKGLIPIPIDCPGMLKQPKAGQTTLQVIVVRLQPMEYLVKPPYVYASISLSLSLSFCLSKSTNYYVNDFASGLIWLK